MIIMSQVTKIETKLELRFSRVYRAIKFFKDFPYLQKIILRF